MKRKIAVIGFFCVGVLITIVGLWSLEGLRDQEPVRMPLTFTYTFNTTETLQESNDPDASKSPYFAVVSGAKLITENGLGQTIQGELFPIDTWRLRYAIANPIDTDGGSHPQNIFRLVTKNYWRNVRVQSYFRITADNFSNSPSRNASNGILIMSRYVDGNTLYYAGVRVDGTAVIKKKYRGAYYTMAQKQISTRRYSPDNNGTSNLLPHKEWFQLRSDTWTDEAGDVHITLYDSNSDGEWREILSAVDDGETFDHTPVIDGNHRIGIRTDFMDVQFRNFHAERL